MMKGSYKTPPDTKEPLDYSYIAGNGKLLDFSESKSLVNSTQGNIFMMHFLFKVTKRYFIAIACPTSL
jgi:hypothetical protein